MSRQTRKSMHRLTKKAESVSEVIQGNYSHRYLLNTAETLQQKEALFNTLCYVLGRADSVFASREIEVVIHGAEWSDWQYQHMNAPAFTDGKQISIQHESFENLFCAMYGNGNVDEQVEALAQIRALNYHELSHVLFTPKLRSTEIDALRREGLFKDFNILEDQRIESLFSTKFPASIPYFKRIVHDFLIKVNSILARQDVLTQEPDVHIGHQPMEKIQEMRDKDRADALAFLLIYGRKYLPRHIRDCAEQKFKAYYKVSDKDMARLKSIIDAFRVCIFPRDLALGCQLVREFAELRKKITGNIDDFGGGSGDPWHHHEKWKAGNTEKVHSTKEIVREMEEQDKRREEQEEEDASDSYSDSDTDDDADDDADSGSKGDTEAEGEGEGDDPEQGDGSGNGGSDDTDEDESSSSDSEESDSSSSSSNGGSTSTAGSNGASSSGELGEFSSATTDALDKANKTTSAMRKDLSRQLKSIREKSSDYATRQFLKDKMPPAGLKVPPVHYRSLTNAISETLAKFKADTDNQWETEENTGKLNLLGYERSRGLHTNFFDQWVDEGDERPDAEVVILLDLSVSMLNPVTICEPNRQFSSYNEAIARLRELQREHYEKNGSVTLIAEASYAMWAVKKACQSHNIPCTVIGYSDSAVCLYSSSDKVTGQAGLFDTSGGTEPTFGMKMSSRIFASSEAKHKILFAITDGDWAVSMHKDSVYSRSLKEIHDKGVKSVFIAIASGANVSVTHDKTWVHSPNFPASVTRGDTEFQYGLDGKVTTVKQPPAYGFSELIAVGNTKELARVIGKKILKGVVQSR